MHVVYKSVRLSEDNFGILRTNSSKPKEKIRLGTMNEITQTRTQKSSFSSWAVSFSVKKKKQEND